MDFTALIISFLLGVIAGGILMEKTRRPHVVENTIKKVKRSDGVNLEQFAQLEAKHGTVASPKPRKKFLGIFKGKPK